MLSSKTSERTNKRQNRVWSCVAYQTPWYHIRVANVSLSKVPTYSLGLPPCLLSHTYAGTIGYPATSTTYLYPPLTSPLLAITVVGQRLSSFSFLFPRFLIPPPDNTVALKPGCTCKWGPPSFFLSHTNMCPVITTVTSFPLTPLSSHSNLPLLFATFFLISPPPPFFSPPGFASNPVI